MVTMGAGWCDIEEVELVEADLPLNPLIHLSIPFPNPTATAHATSGGVFPTETRP